MEHYTPNFELINIASENKNIKAIVEDKDGYLWLATANGIVRYDGKNAIPFFTTNERSSSRQNISPNNVYNLYYDEKANLIYAIFLNKKQIGMLNLNNYEQRIIYYNTLDNIDTRLSSLYNFNDSLLLATSVSNRIYLVNKNNGHTTYAYLAKNLQGWTALNIVEIGGKIYTLISSKLHEIKRGHTPYEIVLNKMKTECIGNLKCIKAVDDSTLMLGATWGESRFAIYEYKLNSKSTRMIFESEGTLTNIIPYKNIIRATTSDIGVVFYDMQTGKKECHNTINSNIVDHRVTTGIKSRNQPIFWYGTGEGLIKENYYNSKIKIYDMRRISESSNCTVYSIHKDINNDLWCLCKDGLYRKRHNEYLMLKQDVKKDPSDHSFLFCFLEDSTRNALYICYQTCIIKHDTRTGTNEEILKSKTRFFGAKLLSDRRLAFISYDGMIIYDPADRSVKYDHDLKRVYDVSNRMAFDFEGDTILWLTDKNKIKRYDLRTKQMTEICELGELNGGINQMRYACRNGIKELWLGSTKDGLIYVLPDMKACKKIDYSPLIADDVRAIEVDRNGNVWAVGEEGIVCINNNNGKYYEYSPDKYGFHTLFNRYSSSQSLDGELYFGGRNLVVQINTNNFDSNKYFPRPVVATYRYINATSYNYDNITRVNNVCFSDTIVVPKGIRSLVLNLDILNYDNLSDNKIAWRSAPSEAWKETSASEPFIVPTLSYGYNNFEFASYNNTGELSSDIHRIYVNKETYLHENPIFQGFAVILIIIGIFLGINIRMQHAKRYQRMLEQEVQVQSGMIMEANKQLKQNQLIIEKHNRELQKSHDNLELEVQKRTIELNNALAKSEENSKLKSAFLANLSHEVRTPMNCIVGFSKLLADPLCSRADQLEFSQLIQDSSKSLMTLISDLLDVSRIESGQMRVNFEEFNVGETIESVYKALVVERKHQDVAFELLTGDGIDDLKITSDRERFRQIIINITYNAFKFTKHGHVTISAEIIDSGQLRSDFFYPTSAPEVEANKKLLMMSIADTGIGVPSDKMDEIFEPFRKLSNNKTHYPGLGLGLNIVRNLITLLKGNIWLTSELNKGTTFYFYLPI